MIEVVVALAILSLMAAITIPVVMHSIDMARVRDTATRLRALRDGIYDPSPGAIAFSQKVGANPGRISELTVPIVASNAASSPNSCGGSFTNGQRNNWIAAGPFVKYTVEPGIGLGTAMGRVEDALTRVPNSATAGEIHMTILETDPNLVQMLDEELNSGDGSAAGSVQWSPEVNGVPHLTFVVPINNKC